MNNRKRKKTWKDTLVKYILLTIAGIILFHFGSEVAYAERGYKAIGGEGFARSEEHTSELQSQR